MGYRIYTKYVQLCSLIRNNYESQLVLISGTKGEDTINVLL